MPAFVIWSEHSLRSTSRHYLWSARRLKSPSGTADILLAMTWNNAYLWRVGGSLGIRWTQTCDLLRHQTGAVAGLWVTEASHWNMPAIAVLFCQQGEVKSCVSKVFQEGISSKLRCVQRAGAQLQKCQCSWDPPGPSVLGIQSSFIAAMCADSFVGMS